MPHVSKVFRAVRSWPSELSPKSPILVSVCSCSPRFFATSALLEKNRLTYGSSVASFFSADELDAFTRKASGGDAAGDIQRLEDALKRLRDDFQEAMRLATVAEEAAAKCQVGPRCFPKFPFLLCLVLFGCFFFQAACSLHTLSPG